MKGHTGVMGNELADLRAKKGVWEGVQEGGTRIAKAAGIRQEFRVTWKSKQVQEWDRDALKGHTYIHTDRGPFKVWLHKIGREELTICTCGKAAQNAAHIMKCELVGEREVGGRYGVLQGCVQVSVGRGHGRGIERGQKRQYT